MSLVGLGASLLLSGNCLDFNIPPYRGEEAMRGRGGQDICGFIVYTPDDPLPCCVISVLSNNFLTEYFFIAPLLCSVFLFPCLLWQPYRKIPH